jgi:hypothetical protein
MSVHWKQRKERDDRGLTQLQLAKKERYDHQNRQQKAEAFKAKLDAGVEVIRQVLNEGKVFVSPSPKFDRKPGLVRSPAIVLGISHDLMLWEAINKVVISIIRDLKDEGFRWVWDDQGIMIQGRFPAKEAKEAKEAA